MDRNETLFKPVGQERVSDQAVRQIVEHVELGHLRPGDKLPSERELTRQLSISRSAVREAIRLLEAQGFLEVRPGLGTFITHRAQIAGLSARWSNWLLEHGDRLLDLLEVRMVLEPLAAALAAKNATLEQVREMYSALNQISRNLSSGHIDGAAESDVRLHQLISQCTGNEFLTELNEGINVSLIENRHAYYSIPGKGKLSNQQHRHIIEAIEANDPEAARQAMYEHIQSARENMRELLEQIIPGKRV